MKNDEDFYFFLDFMFAGHVFPRWVVYCFAVDAAWSALLTAQHGISRSSIVVVFFRADWVGRFERFVACDFGIISNYCCYWIFFWRILFIVVNSQREERRRMVDASGSGVCVWAVHRKTRIHFRVPALALAFGLTQFSLSSFLTMTLPSWIA